MNKIHHSINKKTVTGYKQKGLFDATPPGIIPGTAGSPLRVRAAPPWYWTWRYTTWNYPGNSWLPTKGFGALHPWYCSGRNTTWNKSLYRRREVAQLLPSPPPPFHFSSAFWKVDSWQLPLIGKIFFEKDLVLLRIPSHHSVQCVSIDIHRLRLEPLVVTNLYRVLHNSFKDLAHKAVVVDLRSSFKVIALSSSFKVVELRCFWVYWLSSLSSVNGPE